jgi:hypothetical protein
LPAALVVFTGAGVIGAGLIGDLGVFGSSRCDSSIIDYGVTGSSVIDSTWL